jgi:hypothetical protein
MRAAAVAAVTLAAAACYRNAPPPPATEPADVLAEWRELAPTFARWDLVSAMIPQGDRPRMARAILVAGGFDCPARDLPPPGCAAPARVGLPAPLAGIDDPCMRRVIALWALDVLEPEQLAQVGDALASIAKLPEAEDQLDERLLARLWAESPRRARAVARAAHRIAPTLPVDIDWVRDRDWLAGVAGDATASLEERIVAIDALSKAAPPAHILPRDVRATLIALTTHRSCRLAMHAVAALASHGEPRFLPVRPRNGSVADTARALCMAAVNDAPISAMQQLAMHELYAQAMPPPPGAFVAIGRHGNAEPPLDRTRPLVPVHQHGRVLEHCTNTTCDNGIDRAELVFAPAPDGGHHLTGLVYAPGGSPCQDWTYASAARRGPQVTRERSFREPPFSKPNGPVDHLRPNDVP